MTVTKVGLYTISGKQGVWTITHAKTSEQFCYTTKAAAVNAANKMSQNEWAKVRAQRAQRGN